MKSSKTKVYIESTAMLTVHGLGSTVNFRALSNSEVGCAKLNTSLWPDKVKKALSGMEMEALGSCCSDLEGRTFLDKTKNGLSQIIKELDVFKGEKKGVALKLAVVVASTKHHHEDFIWQGSDPKEEIFKVKAFILDQYPGAEVYFISNACTSGVVGLKFAKKILEQDLHHKVVVLSYDLIGPFVYSGFLSLGAISKEISKPFSTDRDGLHLGEAFAGVVVSKEKESLNITNCEGACIKEVEFLNDGASAIRPTYAVEILPKLYEKMHLTEVDLVLAHGTGTRYNDSAELKAISKKFMTISQSAEALTNIKKPFVTGSKWSLGHSLGASALVDTCLAMEAIKHKAVFGVNLNKDELDPSGHNLVLHSGVERSFKNVLIQSLGFGGVTGCIFLGED